MRYDAAHKPPPSEASPSESFSAVAFAFGSMLYGCHDNLVFREAQSNIQSARTIFPRDDPETCRNLGVLTKAQLRCPMRKR